MRVLFICHRYIDTKIGGVAEFLHYLPLALAALGIEVVLYTQAEKNVYSLQGPEIMENGMRHYSGPFLKPGLFTSQKKLRPLLQLCQQEKIDLIHAQGVYRSGYMAMHVYQKMKIPYVITSHSDILSVDSGRIQRSSVQRRCRQILHQAHTVTHLTPTMAMASNHIYLTTKKDKIIGNGVDTMAWQSSLDLPEKNYIFAIGRLEKGKGFPVLIDAYAELLKKGVSTSLVIAGSGSLEEELRKQAQQLGVEVIFTGYIKGEIKKRWLAESAFVVFATQPALLEEAFGLVQLEAMAAGKALLSSDTHATRHLQQLGLQAVLVKSSHPQDWANEMERLLLDKSFRTQLGKINLRNSIAFDWKIIAAQYKEVYLNIRPALQNAL